MRIRRTEQLHAYRWSEAGIRYFVTACTCDRKTGLQTEPVRSLKRQSVIQSDQRQDTETIAFTVMPDHVHWLFRLGLRLSLGRVVARFKSQTRASLAGVGAEWQRDFFEHRLRATESSEDYARYIYLNPYRAALVSAGNWQGWWTPDSEKLRFFEHLGVDVTPPAEWIGQREAVAAWLGE